MRRNIERGFEFLADNLNEIIARFDDDGRYVYANKQIENATGLPPEYFIGKNHNELNFSADVVKIWEHRLRKVFETRKPVSFEFKYDIPQHGSFYEARLIPEKNTDGKIETILAVIRNISNTVHDPVNKQIENTSSESILSSKDEIDKLDLADIIVVKDLQAMMDNFYNLTHITTAIIDTSGKVLVGVGWQNICTRFHRTHPDTSKNCVESDTELTTDIPDGEFKLYKCKNGLWDLATPIIVGGEHKGNLFMGQFFFDDEPIDYEFFRSKAKQFGFDEKEYMTALENVPRLNAKDLDSAKAFFSKLARSISQLSYSNIKLNRLLDERNNLLDSLRQSEERFRNMFEKTKAIMLLIDPVSGSIVDANEAAAEFYGWSVEQLCTKKIQDINTLSEEEVANERIAALNELRNYFIFPHRLAGKQIRWVEVYSSPVLISGNQMLFSLIHDITERKTFQDNLLKSEENIRAILDATTESILMFDRNGKIITANITAANRLKRSLEEIIGHYYSEFIPAEFAKIRMANIADVFKSGKPVQFEDERNGIVLNHNYYPVFENNIVVRVVAYCEDITERKGAEILLQNTLQRFYLILSGLSFGILLVTDESKVEFVNQVFCDDFSLKETPEEMMNLTSDEMMEKILYSYKNPDVAAARIREIVRQGQPVKDEEVEMIGDRTFLRDFVPILINEKRYGRLWFHIDITKRKKAEVALQISEQRFRLALKNAPVAVAVQDLNLRYTWAYNSRTINTYDIIGKTDSDLFDSEDAQHLVKLKHRVIEFGAEIREKLWVSSNGKRGFLDIYLEPIKDEAGNITGIGIATIDLTQIKLAEQQIEHLASFPKLNPNPVIEADLNGKIIYCNDATLNTLKKLNAGEDVSLFLPDDIYEAINLSHEPDEIQTFIREVNINGGIFSESINFSKAASFLRIYAFEITNRKIAEDQLRKLSSAVQQSPNSIIITDVKGNIEYANPEFSNITGYTLEEVLGKNPKIFKSGKTDPAVYKKLWETILSGKQWFAEFQNKKKSGEIYWESVNIAPVFDSHNSITHFVAVKEDITKRKKVEEKLNQVNRTLNALRHSSEAILHASDEWTYMQEVCKIIVEDCGYRMIWIGFAEEDENKTVRPVASAGFEEGYINSLNITWADTELGQGPTGTTIRTGKPSTCNNLRIDPRFKPWRAEAIKRGYASSVVLPLKDDKKVFGAISIYSSEPDSFSGHEVDLLYELADELAYGISVLRLRHDHELSTLELIEHRDKLEELVQLRTTELSATNELLKEAQEVANIGSWHLDLTFNSLNWSDQVYRIFGIDPASFNLTFEAFLNMIHPDDRNFVAESYTASINNKTFYSLDHRIVRPDGEIRMVHEQCITHYSDDGKPIRSLGVVQDITELKRAEQEIEHHKIHLEDLVKQRTEELDLTNRKLKDEIEKEKQVELLLKVSLDKEKELNELKSNFISTTSHEFRTPLTSILSSMQLIQRYRKKWSDEKIEDQFLKVKNSVFNLTKLLDDILTLSHAESGRITFNPKEIDLYEFCLEILEEIRHLALPTHKFNYEFTSVRRNFVLDPKLIKFIMVNLVSNAFKYSPDGGKVKLAISSTSTDIQISVSDEGIGIPKKDNENLFKPFFRASNIGEIKGTGLGLSIVNRAIEMHQGTLKYQTKLGKGTKFVVNIPWKQV